MNCYEKVILQRLAGLNKWNKSTILVVNILSGVAKHDIGNMKDALKSLIKKQYLNTKPTQYGLKVSLNIRLSKEIKLITNSP